MLDRSLIPLVYLHSAWCSHADMKKLFLSESPISYTGAWVWIKNRTLKLDTTEERNKKIQEKSQEIEEEKIVKLLDEKNIEIITWEDKRYPERLKTIGHAPYFLYVRWDLRESLPPLIGVVGSRKHTPYAKRILEKILPDIILSGVWIISGGATGVDAMWHDITLAQGGYTIAVFGTGIDRCYPAGNKSLFENILAKGWVLISHFPIGTWPELYNFPIRNEIVAALASGILIPEAGLSSGTLITAQLALEHGRDVFAVPGDIDRATSEGSNMLISSGQAKCVRCSGDILEEYFDLTSLGAGMTPIVKVAPIFTHEKEKIVYESVERGMSSVDDIARETDLGMSDLLITLSMLEILGHISIDEMGKYRVN